MINNNNKIILIYFKIPKYNKKLYKIIVIIILIIIINNKFNKFNKFNKLTINLLCPTKLLMRNTWI